MCASLWVFVQTHHVDNAISITHHTCIHLACFIVVVELCFSPLPSLPIHITSSPLSIHSALIHSQSSGLLGTALPLWRYFLANSFPCLCLMLGSLALGSLLWSPGLESHCPSCLHPCILPSDTCCSRCTMGKSNFRLSQLTVVHLQADASEGWLSVLVHRPGLLGYLCSIVSC